MMKKKKKRGRRKKRMAKRNTYPVIESAKRLIIIKVQWGVGIRSVVRIAGVPIIIIAINSRIHYFRFCDNNNDVT